MSRTQDARTTPDALRASIERALRRDEPQGDVIPMLERLQRISLEGSDHKRFADRRLAELLLETEPWRAAVYLRRLLAGEERDDLGRAGHEDDAHWALMGLAQALLGNHRFAARAYRKALSIDPGNPWYAHNLGHVLDVALDRPVEALRHLELAHKRVPDAPPIACSYAHALWRVSRIDDARRILAPLMSKHGRDPDVLALVAELDRASPPAPRRRKRAAKKPKASV
jgi:predicted Zn-dependent protease